MQQSGPTTIAEDSCSIKNHPQDGRIGSEVAPAVPRDPESLSVNSEAPSVVDEKNIERRGGGGGAGAVFDDDDTAPREEEPPHRTKSKQLGMTGLDDKDDFPEGGFKAWSVVVGAFCGSFSVFALINSTGVLLQYLQTNQLKDYTSAEISWIFGVELFLTFFCGAPVGPIFDAYGPRVMVFIGSVLLVSSLLLLGLCTGKSSTLNFPLTSHH